MQTDTVFAWQVEPGDFIHGDPDPLKVTLKDDTADDFIMLTVEDDDGEVTELPYGPFDSVFIITAFDEEVEFEDVPIE